MTEELQSFESPEQLAIQRAPQVVLAEARQAALALQEVIAHKANPVIFNNEQYLEFEDWQTVARFYSYVAMVDATTPVEFEGVRGWEAHACVVDIRTGIKISAADAMCLNDEEKWRARPKYEYHYVLRDGSKSAEDPADKSQLVWVDNPKKPGKKMPKKERVLIGLEPVPLFQLRSMAQTRACAKALRNVLAWVVVLAGYKPTPAEEMTGNEQIPVAQTAPTPIDNIDDPRPTQEEAPQTHPPVDPADTRPITVGQRRRLFAIYKSAGWTDQQAKDVVEAAGFTTSTEITRTAYPAIIQTLSKPPGKQAE